MPLMQDYEVEVEVNVRTAQEGGHDRADHQGSRDSEAEVNNIPIIEDIVVRAARCPHYITPKYAAQTDGDMCRHCRAQGFTPNVNKYGRTGRTGR